MKAHSAQQEQLNLSVLSVVLVRKGSVGNVPYVLNTEAVSILCRADKTTFISSLCLFKHLSKRNSKRLLPGDLTFKLDCGGKHLKNGVRLW